MNPKLVKFRYLPKSILKYMEEQEKLIEELKKELEKLKGKNV